MLGYLKSVLGFKKAEDAVPEVLPSEFTVADLAKYKGHNNGVILIALRGVVYDVSKGRDFYGPEGGYNKFSGSDASRCLAKMSFDLSELNKEDLSDLTAEESQVLDDWIKRYDEKYTRVGTVKWN